MNIICQRKAVAEYIRVFPLTTSMHGNTKNYNCKNYNSKNYSSKNYNSNNYNSNNHNSNNYNSCRYQTRSWILPRTSYPIGKIQVHGNQVKPMENSGYISTAPMLLNENMKSY